MAVKDLDLTYKQPMLAKPLHTYGVVVEETPIANLYTVDACREDDWLRCLAIELPEDERNRIIELLYSKNRRMRHGFGGSYSQTYVSSHFPGSSGSLSFEPVRSTSVDGSVVKEINEANPDNDSSDQSSSDLPFQTLLRRLKEGVNSPVAETLQSVLAIQSRAIPSQLLDETLKTLRLFIRGNRGSNDSRVVLAVGSAIRKLLLNLENCELSVAVDLLRAEGNLTIAIDLELEVAKMVVHRLQSDPLIATEDTQELTAILADIAIFYSTPRMVNREKYGATALNSMIAIVLMNRFEADSLCSTVLSHAPEWFIQLARRRLDRIVKRIRQAGSDAATQWCEAVESLEIMKEPEHEQQTK